MPNEKNIYDIDARYWLAFGSVTANAQSNADERISAIDNTPSVRPSSGGIEITVQGESTSTFYIYSITGQMVKSVDISGSTFIDLPRDAI